MHKTLSIEEYNEKGVCFMSKKLTTTKLKMAAAGNNMMEAGAELYSDPKVKNKIKEKQEKDGEVK